MGIFFSDLRFALATARRNRALALGTTVTLALGIGTAAAVFSVVDGVLLRPLPYRDPDGLVRLYEEHPGSAAPLGGHHLSSLTYRAWLERGPDTIAGIGIYGAGEYTLALRDGPARVPGASVSPALFDVLGEAPAMGHFFDTDAGIEGSARVVILTDRFWRQHFGADPAIVGRPVVVNGISSTILGIARPGFTFPNADTLLWTPYAVPARGGKDRVSAVTAIARLRPGVTPAQAAAEGTAAARSTGPPPFESQLLFGAGGPPVVKVERLARDMTSSVRPAIQVMAMGVLLVLLVACANVGNLLLSRGIARERELAIRTAIGASRGRLVRQLLTESLTWSTAGGIAGLGLGWILLRGIAHLAPADFPRLDNIRMDGRVAAVAAALSMLAAIAAGLAAALRGSAVGVAALQGSDRAGGTGHSSTGARWLRDALLIGQTTLAVVLVICAALLGRSFVRLIDVNAGYDPRHVLTARVYLPAAQNERARLMLDAVLARARSLPGIVSAGGGNMMPLGDSTFLTAFMFPEREAGKPVMVQAREYAVTAGYAEALGLQLREGRLLDARDGGSAASAVLVNEEFARLYLPAGGVAGRLIPTGMGSSGKPALIVGVVRNVLKDGFASQPQPDIYVTLDNGMPLHEIDLVVRTDGDPASFAPALRSLIRESDPAAAAHIAPLAELVSASIAQPRFASAVLGGFAALALVLAAVGLHSALSYAVSQRRRELGIRAALGAERRDLMGLVFRRAAAVTGIGLVLGCAAAAACSQLLGSLLFGVSSLDLLAFIIAPALLAPAALAAALWPALRAARSDPAEVLRAP